MKHFEPDKQDYHYYASSCATWRCMNDVSELIRYMRSSAEGLNFAVWRVALPIEAHYPIVDYAPVVDEGVLVPIGRWVT